MRKSDSTIEIAKALAQFQAEVKPVYFDSNNPYYNSKYASLGQIIDAIRAVAPALGLSWTQLPIGEQNEVGVQTIILHSSGEFIANEITVSLPSEFSENSKGQMKQANLIQEAGKYITYLRRYALASAFGLYSEEDNDGNSPESPQTSKIPQKSPAPAQTRPMSQTSPRLTRKQAEKSLRPYKPEQLVENLKRMATRLEPATAKDLQTLVGVLSQWAEGNEDLRHAVQEYLFGVESIKAVDLRMVSAALAWIKPQWDTESKSYLLGEFVEDELDLVYNELS